MPDPTDPDATRLIESSNESGDDGEQPASNLWSRIRLWHIAAGVVVIGLVGFFFLAGGSEAEAGIVFLEAAADPGADPFTEPVWAAAPDLILPGVDRGGATTGDTPGLYAVDSGAPACSRAALREQLEADPQVKTVWLQILGVDESEFESYVESLTPVFLLSDTRLTNHGYVDGQAQTRQSILQAGTSVLVDIFGVPRVRCASGSPLLEPIFVEGAVQLRGEPWSGFDLDRVVSVYPAPQPMDQVEVTPIGGGPPILCRGDDCFLSSPTIEPGQTLLVTVTTTGDGVGQVIGEGVVCPGVCQVEVGAGEAIELRAVPGDRSMFVGWSGECEGTGRCRFEVTGDAEVSAEFGPSEDPSLTVALLGGNGQVVSDPEGISCDPRCTAVFPERTVVTLEATPVGDAAFLGWTVGAGSFENRSSCQGTGLCTLTMDASTQVTATFTEVAIDDDDHVLNVVRVGSGSVTSSDGAINCGRTCTHAYPDPISAVSLEAIPSPGWVFTGWNGGGCSTSTTCTISVEGLLTVTAIFAPDTHRVTVSFTGDGSGMVTLGSQICTSTCSDDFAEGTLLSLAATASAGSSFAKYTGGGCGAANPCSLTVTGDVTITAEFVAVITHDLSIRFQGGGIGSIAVSPNGGSCTSDCTVPIAENANVQLTVSGGDFTGWTGGGPCSGSSPTCTFRITANTVVRPYFNEPPVASDDSVSYDRLDIGDAKSVDVVGNDSDQDGDALSVSSVTCVSGCSHASSGPSHTSSAVTFTIATAPEGSGTQSIVLDYTISDGQGHTDTGRLTITVDYDNPVAIPGVVGEFSLTALGILQGSGFTNIVNVCEDTEPDILPSVTNQVPGAGTTVDTSTQLTLKHEGDAIFASRWPSDCIWLGPPVLTNGSGEVIELNSDQCSAFPPEPYPHNFGLYFDYSDPDGDVSNSSVVTVSSSKGMFTTTASDHFTNRSGSGTSGSYSIFPCYHFGGSPSITFSITLKDDSGRVSNTIMITVARPSGAS